MLPASAQPKLQWLIGVDSKFIRMWPRSVFEGLYLSQKTRKQKHDYQKHKKHLDLLDRPGVYVLYDNERHARYVGRSISGGGGVGERILTHVAPNARYARDWTRFSVFFVDDPQLRKAIESILITAIPTLDNAQRPMGPYKLPVKAHHSN